MATTDTYCRVTTCAFHHPEDRCAAGEIMVDLTAGKAFCDTFVPRDVNKQPASQKPDLQTGYKMRTGNPLGDDNLSVNLGNATHMYEGLATNLTPVVGCRATDCSYNQHNICFADRIVIDGPDADISRTTNCNMYNP